MAKQTINTGTSNDAGNGDNLRTAFTKINENFSELYTLTGSSNTAALKDIKGSVFADDSSQMLDAETQTLYGTIVATAGTAPTVSGQPGAVGEIRFDDNYIYVKTSGAGWKRAALSGLV